MHGYVKNPGGRLFPGTFPEPVPPSPDLYMGAESLRECIRNVYEPEGIPQTQADCQEDSYKSFTCPEKRSSFPFCINTESESFFLSALSFVLASYIFIRVLYGISILRAMKNGQTRLYWNFLRRKTCPRIWQKGK